jgi:hypothetical protein
MKKHSVCLCAAEREKERVCVHKTCVVKGLQGDTHAHKNFSPKTHLKQGDKQTKSKQNNDNDEPVFFLLSYSAFFICASSPL